MAFTIKKKLIIASLLIAGTVFAADPTYTKGDGNYWLVSNATYTALSGNYYVGSFGDGGGGGGVEATGGTITDYSTNGIDYRAHTFTSDGTFTVTVGGDVEYLVVAGGGGGGSAGGGAGGYVTTSMVVSATPYPVIIGSGGNGTNGASSTTPPGSGEDSRFGDIYAFGGGYGGYGNGSLDSRAGGDGGSGGGAGIHGGADIAAGAASPPGQGLSLIHI